MIFEAKAAHLLNSIMVSILGLTALGFICYSTAVHFSFAREAYDALSPESQRHVGGFLNSAMMLFFALCVLARWAGDALRKLKTRTPHQQETG
jgi:hypothetical protein